MAVHIARMTSEVGITGGDMPLSPAQIETIVAIVMRRLDERDRDRKAQADATTVRDQATPTT